MTNIIDIKHPPAVVYLDTSFILSQKDMKRLDCMFNIRLIPEVIQEIRNGNDPYSNYIIDTLLSRGALIVSGSDFDQVSGLQAYKFMLQFATQLHPYLKQRIDYIESQNLSPEEEYLQKLREVDQVSRRGQIWGADVKILTKEKYEIDQPPTEHYKTILEMNRFTFNSWYQYHKNRFRGLFKNEYKWTDEKIVATAVTEAFVRRKRVFIVTQDKDFNTIFWQFSNNLMLFKLVRQIRGQQLSPDDFWKQFSKICTEYNSFYEETINQKYKADIAERKAKNEKIHPVLVGLSSLRKREIGVHYWVPDLGRSLVNQYIFPEEMINQLLDAARIIKIQPADVLRYTSKIIGGD